MKSCDNPYLVRFSTVLPTALIEPQYELYPMHPNIYKRIEQNEALKRFSPIFSSDEFFLSDDAKAIIDKILTVQWQIATLEINVDQYRDVIYNDLDPGFYDDLVYFIQSTYDMIVALKNDYTEVSLQGNVSEKIKLSINELNTRFNQFEETLDQDKNLP